MFKMYNLFIYFKYCFTYSHCFLSIVIEVFFGLRVLQHNFFQLAENNSKEFNANLQEFKRTKNSN